MTISLALILSLGLSAFIGSFFGSISSFLVNRYLPKVVDKAEYTVKTRFQSDKVQSKHPVRIVREVR